MKKSTIELTEEEEEDATHFFFGLLEGVASAGTSAFDELLEALEEELDELCDELDASEELLASLFGCVWVAKALIDV